MFIFNYLIPLRESKNEAGGSRGGGVIPWPSVVLQWGELQSQSELFVDWFYPPLQNHYKSRASLGYKASKSPNPLTSLGPIL